MHSQTNHSSVIRGSAWKRASWLALYLVLLLIGSGLFLTHRVSAALNERGLAIGRRLDAFQELRGRVTELSFNGEELALSTAVIDRPVGEVLEQFIGLCSAENGALARELSAAFESHSASFIERALVLRDLFDDGTGTAVCLSGLADGGLTGLLQRARRFITSWDFSELGQLRYTFVRKLTSERTHVLLVSADGPLRLNRLFPLDGGDAPGDDAIAGARPAQSTRLLSAHAKGTSHAFTAYRSALPADAALASYDAALRAKGFERAVNVGNKSEAVDQGLRVRSATYHRGAEAFVVSSQSDEAGSLLSVVALGDRAIPGPFDAEARSESREPLVRGEERVRDPALR